VPRARDSDSKLASSEILAFASPRARVSIPSARRSVTRHREALDRRTLESLARVAPRAWSTKTSRS